MFCSVILIFSALVIIFAGALMAIFIGLILPPFIRIEQPITVSKGEAKFAGIIYRGEIYEPNWLVSISWQRYTDVNDSWEFFCPGTIIHTNKVLTGNGCLKEHFTEKDFLRGQVRSGSQYIFEGGQIHEIKDLRNNNSLKSPYKNIFILEVHPSFSEDIKKPIILLGRPVADMELESEIYSVSWGGFQIPTEQIRRFDPFHFEKWYSPDNVSCINNLCYKATNPESDCCVEANLNTVSKPMEPVIISGKALVVLRTSKPPVILSLQLVYLDGSVQTSEGGSSRLYFVDLTEPELIEWLKLEVPQVLYFHKTNKRYLFRDKLYSKVRTADYMANVNYLNKINPVTDYFYHKIQ